MIHTFESLGSTSDKAKELLGENTPLPFGVLAKEQTKGRGRLGASWLSPPGGLFLTVALLPGGLDMAKTSLLPLAAGVLVADVIKEHFGIRVTLKWPNDILFQGRKLGGLLCETLLSGDKASGVFIGIGLNLKAAPKLPKGHVSSISMQQASGPEAQLPREKLARALYETIVSGLLGEEPLKALSRYEDYAIEKGQIYLDAKGAPFSMEKVTDEGSLLLSSQQGQVTLLSCRHEYTWQFLAAESEKELWLFDLGNTALKIGYFEKARKDDAPKKVWSLPLREDLEAFFRKVLLPSGVKVVYGSSVNPDAFAMVQKAAGAIGVLLQQVPKRTLRVRLDHYPLKEIGMDRLAFMEAVLGGTKGGHAALCVSFGTATTIDVLGGGGRHLGGYILPGLSTYLESLFEAGGLLPHLSCESLWHKEADLNKDPLGHSTSEAIGRGLLQGLALWRPYLMARYGILPERVFLTGGFSEKMQPYFPGRVVGGGVLLGLREMLLGGR